MDEPVLAIDFGTSASSAVLVTGWDTPDYQLVDREGRVWWESAVCWSNGRMWVGAEAKARQANRAYGYRNQFKRALRDSTPMVLGEREFTPVELVTEVLREMRRRANESYAPGVRRAVLTVPPSYTELGDPRAGLMAELTLPAKVPRLYLPAARRRAGHRAHAAYEPGSAGARRRLAAHRETAGAAVGDGPGITDVAGVAGVRPAVHRGLVFAGTVDGVMVACEAATGELRWRRFLGAEVTSPVTVAGATLYVGCADGGLYALMAETAAPVAPLVPSF